MPTDIRVSSFEDILLVLSCSLMTQTLRVSKGQIVVLLEGQEVYLKYITNSQGALANVKCPLRKRSIYGLKAMPNFLRVYETGTPTSLAPVISRTEGMLA